MAPKSAKGDGNAVSTKDVAGNGSAKSHMSSDDDFVHENIFLFWPNIIGATIFPPRSSRFFP
jgi:hypothetical protein